MKAKDILAQLETLGNEARRAHNAKAGAPKNQFGVPMGEIRKLAAKIKTNHALALELWETGNVEAQLLATLILKPKELSAEELDRLVRSITFAYVADWLLNGVVAQHPDNESLRLKWLKDKDRWAARAGWHLTAGRVSRDAQKLDLGALLDRIEKELSGARPEVQWTMNNTLMAIGIHHAKHRARAIKIGESVGLYRDWPVSKGCVPPYAPVAIREMAERKA